MRAPANLSLAVLPVLLACIPQPVAWDAAVTRTPGSLTDRTRLVLEGAPLTPRFVTEWTPPAWPDEPGLCVTSRAAVVAIAGDSYASWFTARADSSVILRVARSEDGGRTWRAAVTADATDVGRTGCDRPAPFLAADSLNGYVHLVYHLVAREGAGLFFTHSMERGAMFHQPVPIVYGDRPSAASVASRGDTVIVAYEDPNSRLPRLGLALSRTQGHIFEARIAASDESGEARLPRVAVRDGRIALAWTAIQRGGGAPRVAMRLGTLVR